LAFTSDKYSKLTKPENISESLQEKPISPDYVITLSGCATLFL